MLHDQLQICYPRHPLLREHIAYYYFLRTEPDFYSRYFSFPNTITSFNIHRGVKADIDRQRIAVRYNGTNDHLIILQGKYERPLEVELSGRLDKVTIGFKPLGLGHFIDQHYGKAAPHASQVFTGWDTDARYQELLRRYYATNDLDQRVELLEQFLLSRFHPVPGIELLNIALALLGDEAQLSISAIAGELELTERTFNRLFHRHMGVSPSAYRMILRFRRSMEVKLFSDRLMSLTEACYRSGFYDQAYFNKLYRKATGATPGRFFQEVNKLAEDRLIFKVTA